MYSGVVGRVSTVEPDFTFVKLLSTDFGFKITGVDVAIKNIKFTRF